MTVGGFLEFVLGNTFPFVVFISFGAFWLTLAATLQPFYNAYGAYAPAGEPASSGIATEGFTASFGFFLLFMGLLCFIYLICSLRTNVAFVIIFLSLVVGFGLLTGSYWNSAMAIASTSPARAAAKLAIAQRTQVGAGASFLVTCLAGWWIFFAIMLASLDFPFQVPVGDLSTLIKGASERKNERDMV